MSAEAIMWSAAMPKKLAGIFVWIVLILVWISNLSARADDIGSILDQACGAVVSNIGCSDVATAYPEALGGVIAAVGAAHGQFSSADDCDAKLSAGSSILASVSQYLDVPGLPFNKLKECGCGIVFASGSCTGTVQKGLDDIGKAVSDFFSAIGLGGSTQPPDDHEKDKSDYYNANYAPLLDKLLDADGPTIADALRPVTQACVDDWWGPQWVSDANSEICGPFYHQFINTLAARQKLIADQAAAEAQAKADALQAVKDKYTDQARKYAMNWAQIKLGTYAKQCADTACRNDVGVLAFVYYGMIATGMQDPNSSNTAALSAANAKFDPLFKQKVAESGKRKLDLALLGLSQVKVLTAPLMVRAQKFDGAMAVAQARLHKLGVQNPDQLLKNSRFSRFRNVTKARSLAPVLTPVAPLRPLRVKPLIRLQNQQQ
jgi:hypothetical protein